MKKTFPVPVLLLLLLPALSAPARAVQGIAERLGALLEEAGIPNPYAPLTEITHNRMYVPEWAEYLRLDVKVEEESGDDVLQVIFRKAPFVQGDPGVTKSFAVKEITSGWMTHYVKVPGGFAGETATVTLRLCSTDPAERIDPGNPCSGVDSEILVDDIFFAMIVPSDDDPPGDSDGNGDEDNRDGVMLFFEREDSPEPEPSISGERIVFPVPAEALPLTRFAPSAPEPTVSALASTPPPSNPVGIDRSIIYINTSNSVTVRVQVRVANNDFLVFVGSNGTEYPFNNQNGGLLELNPGMQTVDLPPGGRLVARFKARLNTNYLPNHPEEEIIALRTQVTVEAIGRLLNGKFSSYKNIQGTRYDLVFILDNADEDRNDSAFKFASTLEGTARTVSVANHADVRADVFSDPKNPSMNAAGEFRIIRGANQTLKGFEYKALAHQQTGNDLATGIMFTYNGQPLFSNSLAKLPQLVATNVAQQVINIPAAQLAAEARRLLEKCRTFDPKNCGVTNNLYQPLLNLLGSNPDYDQAEMDMAAGIKQGFLDVFGIFAPSAAMPPPPPSIPPSPTEDLRISFKNAVFTDADSVTLAGENLRIVDLQTNEGYFHVIIDTESILTSPNPSEELASSILDFDYATFEAKLFTQPFRASAQDKTPRRIRDDISWASKRFILDRTINLYRTFHEDPNQQIAESIYIFLGRILRYPGDTPSAFKGYPLTNFEEVGKYIGRNIAHEVGHTFGLMDEYLGGYVAPTPNFMGLDPGNRVLSTPQRQELRLGFDSPLYNLTDVRLDQIDKLIEVLEVIENSFYWGWVNRPTP